MFLSAEIVLVLIALEFARDPKGIYARDRTPTRA